MSASYYEPPRPSLVHTVPQPADFPQTAEAMRKAEVCIVTASALSESGGKCFMKKLCEGTEASEDFPKVSLVVFDDCHTIASNPGKSSCL